MHNILHVIGVANVDYVVEVGGAISVMSHRQGKLQMVYSLTGP